MGRKEASQTRREWAGGRTRTDGHSRVASTSFSSGSRSEPKYVGRFRSSRPASQPATTAARAVAGLPACRRSLTIVSHEKCVASCSQLGDRVPHLAPATALVTFTYKARKAIQCVPSSSNFPPTSSLIAWLPITLHATTKPETERMHACAIDANASSFVQAL